MMREKTMEEVHARMEGDLAWRRERLAKAEAARAAAEYGTAAYCVAREDCLFETGAIRTLASLLNVDAGLDRGAV